MLLSEYYQYFSVNQVELMQKLNVQFLVLNVFYYQADDSFFSFLLELVQVDFELFFFFLVVELEEMEKVYSIFVVQRFFLVNFKLVYLGVDFSRLRVSLVLELKGLRKVFNSENDFEC